MAQKQLAVRAGYAAQNTCKVMVASLYPGNAVVNCNGVNYPVAMNAIGADRGTPVTFNGSSTTTAGYVGSATLTGLNAFTQYDYTASQGGRTASGKFRTAPRDTDDFTLFFLSCTHADGASGDSRGFFHYINNYCEDASSLPCAGIFFVDDYDYAGQQAAATFDDTAVTGHVATAAAGSAVSTAHTQYDFALFHLAQLGLLGDESKTAIKIWNSDVRQYSVQNLNWMMQWGDWEVANDMGWNYSLDVYNQQAYTVSKPVFLATWGLINPPLCQNRDTYTIPWAGTYGPLRFVAPDGLSRGNTLGGASAPYPNIPVAFGGGDATNNGMTVFGSNQIDDVLDALNTTDPFKLLLSQTSIRAIAAGEVGATLCGANHPLYDTATAEYRRLYTAIGNTPKSIMDNPNTNGASGQLAVLLGDYHCASVLRNQATAYSGNAAESFMSMCVATSTGSQSVSKPNIPNGTVFNGSTVEFLQNPGLTTSGAYIGSVAPEYYGIRIDVRGSRSPKTMDIHLVDQYGKSAHSMRYVQGRGGNLPVGSGFLR